MSVEELVRLVEGGDLHGAMLLVVREWARKYHPEIEYASVIAHSGDAVPDVVIPVTPLPASA